MYHFELQSCMDIFISHLFCCTMPENLYNTYIFFHKKEIITPYQFWCKKYKFVVEQNTDCSIWFKSIYGSEKRRHLVASVRIKSENYNKFTYYATWTSITMFMRRKYASQNGHFSWFQVCVAFIIMNRWCVFCCQGVLVIHNKIR